MRGVREIVGSKDQGLGESAVLLLVLVGVALELFKDLAIRVRRRYLALNLGRVELPLVLKEVKLLRARFWVNETDLLALLQEQRR